MTKQAEPPGDTIASQRMMDDLVAKRGIAVAKLEHMIHRLASSECYVKAIRFVYRDGPKGEVLVTITADVAEGPVVAFHGGSSFGEALQGLQQRLANGSLKWKEDQYAK